MYPYGRNLLWLPILQNQGRETSVSGLSPNLPEVLYISSMLAESGVHRVMAEWSPAGLFPSANLTLYNCTPAPTPRTVGHSWRPQEKTCIQAFMCTATGLPEWHLAGELTKMTTAEIESKRYPTVMQQSVSVPPFYPSHPTSVDGCRINLKNQKQAQKFLYGRIFWPVVELYEVSTNINETQQ